MLYICELYSFSLLFVKKSTNAMALLCLKGITGPW